MTSISFNIPLAEERVGAAGRAHFVTQAEINGHMAPAECPGTIEEPRAEPGFLCVYGRGETMEQEGPGGALGVPFEISSIKNYQAHGYGKTGALLWFEYSNTKGPANTVGTWAVTEVE